MINLRKILSQLTPECPMPRDKICEWLRDEMKNRSGIELGHYLNDFVYDMVNPGFVLTLKFPLPANFFDPLFCDVEINSGEDRDCTR